MKNKFIIVVVVSLFVATACSKNLAVQQASPASVSEMDKNDPDTIDINNVNAKVLRSFYMNYGEITNAKWFRFTSGFAVSFKNNGMHNIIHYKPNGMVESEIHSYSEDRLPLRVRQLIRSGFYHYTILHITEVNKNGATAYYVKVEDASTIKTVKVVDEEWEVVESMIKR